MDSSESQSQQYLHQEDEDHESRVERFLSKLRRIPGAGVLLAAASGLCFATSGFSSKLMTGDIGEGVDGCIVFAVMSVFMIAFYLPVAIIMGQPLLGVTGERKFLIQRVVSGFIVGTTYYYAFSFISLGEGSTIALAAPVFASLFACIMIREPCGAFDVASIAVTMIGLVLITRPSFLFHADLLPADAAVGFSPEQRIIGATFAFVCCIVMAYSFVIMRSLTQTPVAVIITWYGIFSVIAAILVDLVLAFTTSFHVRLPVTSDWKFLILCGSSNVIGQFCLTMALKIEQAGLVSVARMFDIVMAFVYQVVFLHEPAPMLSVIGAIIVTGACVACGLRAFWKATMEKVSQKCESEARSQN
jgi:drug/metabolite transporter (DMT)-like permease